MSYSIQELTDSSFRPYPSVAFITSVSNGVWVYVKERVLCMCERVDGKEQSVLNSSFWKTNLCH